MITTYKGILYCDTYNSSGTKLSHYTINTSVRLANDIYSIFSPIDPPEISFEDVAMVNVSFSQEAYSILPDISAGISGTKVGNIRGIGSNLLQFLPDEIDLVLIIPKWITHIADGSQKKVSKIDFEGTLLDWASINFTSTSNINGSNYIWDTTKLFCNNIEITEEIDLSTEEITLIKPLAFANCSSITGIIINSSCDVAETSFNNCINLTKITVNNCNGDWDLDLTQFSSLSNIVFVGSTINFVREGIFSSCHLLSNIDLNGLINNTTCEIIDNILYQNKKLFHCLSNYSKTTLSTIPSDCVRICDGSFQACGNQLKNILILEDRENPLELGKNVFYTEIENVIVLKEGLFSKEEIQNNNIGQIKQVGYNCNYLSEKYGIKEMGLLVNNDITEVYYYKHAAAGQDDLNPTLLMIPEGVEKITSSFFSFYDWSYLNIYFPSTIKNIVVYNDSDMGDLNFYYKGSKADWEEVSRTSDNLTIKYFSMSEPENEEDYVNYWTLFSEGFKLTSAVDEDKIFDSYGFKIFKDGSISSTAGEIGGFTIADKQLSAKRSGTEINLTPRYIEAIGEEEGNTSYCRMNSNGSFEGNNVNLTGKINALEGTFGANQNIGIGDNGFIGPSYALTDTGLILNKFSETSTTGTEVFITTDGPGAKIGFEEECLQFVIEGDQDIFKIYLLMQNWGPKDSWGNRWQYGYAIYCENTDFDGENIKSLPEQATIPIHFLVRDNGNGRIIAEFNKDFTIEKGKNQSEWYNNAHLHEWGTDDRNITVNVVGSSKKIYVGALSDAGLVTDYGDSQDDNLLYDPTGASETNKYIKKTDLKNYQIFNLSSQTRNLYFKKLDLIPNETDQNIGSSDHYWNTIFVQNADTAAAAVSEDLEVGGTTYDNSGSAVTSSDVNVKNNIEPLSDKYSVLFDELKPVSYKYNVGTSGRLHTGFIAQDVKSAMDAAALTTSDFAGYCEWVNDDGSSETGLRYAEFIALCVKEIQDLKKKVTSLEEKLINATFDKVD